ncbi:MAG TPA: 1,4-alpha-glucan branching protein GlgB [Alphaproteobacteria bacterium]
MRGQIDAVVRGEHDNPFYFLGMHRDGESDEVIVRSFQPGAARVWVIDASTGAVVAELDRVHPDGFFVGRTGRKERFRYRLRRESAGRTVDVEDPYRFPPVLGELDLYLWAEGRHLRAYEKLGAHPRTIEGVAGVTFAVWAPNARRVSVVGPFNNWDGRYHVMRRRVEAGIWEVFIPGLDAGELYKYEIRGADGTLLPLKSDPFGLRAEHPPRTASIVATLGEEYRWRDSLWMTSRARANARTAPLSIYECHLGSWARVPEEGGRPLRYGELGDRLVPYIKDMGFTHVELLPISEYPFDGSWGYQPIGLYAPTSRFGTPDEFRALVDRFHEAGIGVLIDWVPGHFPTDAHGLARFDGTALYEHADPRQGFHQDWNTLIYNYGRNEVSNFLIANALFWLDRYHIDGLRVDAVASMLYLDYSRKPGEWVPNRYGGNENIDATAFLRRMNELVFAEHPGTTTVAEESTAWAAVSRPTYVGGLGFGYKWNMGWMHDTLRYMSREPVYRRFHHHDLTFGLLYAFSENFVLPLSHDEVVHGKGSLITRMPGDRWQKFANLRAYFGFMFSHPGKKLLFMGGEFGQEREWNHDTSLDWHLLSDPLHRGVQDLVRDLNKLYRGSPALHELDCEPPGFEWIEASDTDNSVLSFLRRNRDGDRLVVVVCSFTPVVRRNYRLGVPNAGRYLERVNTDSAIYGGSNVGNAGGVATAQRPSHGRPHSVELTLPPLATLILEWCP